MVSMVRGNRRTSGKYGTRQLGGGHVVSMVRGNRRTSGKYGTMQ